MAERNGEIRLKQVASLKELTINVRQAECKPKPKLVRMGYFEIEGCGGRPLTRVEEIFVDQKANVYDNRYYRDAAGAVLFHSPEYIAATVESEIGQDYRHIGIAFLPPTHVYRISHGEIAEVLDCRSGAGRY